MTKHQKEKIYNYLYSEQCAEWKDTSMMHRVLGIFTTVFTIAAISFVFVKKLPTDKLFVGIMLFDFAFGVINFVLAHTYKKQIEGLRDYINFNGGELCSISKTEDEYNVDMGYIRTRLTEEQIEEIIKTSDLRGGKVEL